MPQSVALFDIDTREINENRTDLMFRPRVKPIETLLSQMFCHAKENEIPLIFSTCCSGRMLTPFDFDDILFIPKQNKDVKWRKSVSQFDTFYIEKNTHGVPMENFRCRAYDILEHNHNVIELLHMLSIKTVVLFGNGFELCLFHAADKLIKAGFHVIVMDGIFIPSAKKYRTSHPDAYGSMERLSHLGIEKMDFGMFQNWFETLYETAN